MEVHKVCKIETGNKVRIKTEKQFKKRNKNKGIERDGTIRAAAWKFHHQ
jgi:hypothetical protein